MPMIFGKHCDIWSICILAPIRENGLNNEKYSERGTYLVRVVKQQHNNIGPPYIYVPTST